MTNIDIPKLSKYQYGLLCHTAAAAAPIFLLPKPAREDKPQQRYKLQERDREIMCLVDIGLMEDASDEFRESIVNHSQHTGRKFKVYGLTQVGYLLFKDCEARVVH